MKIYVFLIIGKKSEKKRKQEFIKEYEFPHIIIK